jgi:hypothetical protein
MTHSELKQHAVNTIRRSYSLLSQEQDLSPVNARVNEQLTELVRTLTRCQSAEISGYLLDAPELATEREHLPALCGEAECEMEKFWARHLIGCGVCDISKFWYYPEYQELCRAEKALFEESRSFDTISFLGAGALPLTAFLLARHLPGTKVTCVDFDAEACDLALQLSRKIGIANDVEIRCMDALQYAPRDHELVICASLLQGREEIYSRLQNHHCAMIVRDSEGAYQFLYKAAELPEAGFRQVAKTDIDPRRINTSRYYERDMEFANHAAA